MPRSVKTAWLIYIDFSIKKLNNIFAKYFIMLFASFLKLSDHCKTHSTLQNMYKHRHFLYNATFFSQDVVKPGLICCAMLQDVRCGGSEVRAPKVDHVFWRRQVCVVCVRAQCIWHVSPGRFQCGRYLQMS